MSNILSSLIITVLALPVTNLVQVAPPPAPTGSTFYSYQHPDYPPFPANLFPNLPVYEVEPKVYVIDDRGVDYNAGRVMMASSGGPPVPGPGGGQPQPPPVLSPHSSTLGLTDLWVNISPNPPTNFFLDVFNTTPGVQYGIGAKNSIDPDPFNTWSLVNVFEATASTQRLAGSASSPMRFYRAVNLDQYSGPRVQIVSPAPGSTVSGDVPLEVAITDILPLFTIEVFVGEILAGSIQPGQGGRVTISSYWFPNGPQEIWVRVVNKGGAVDSDGDGFAESPTTLQGWAFVPVTFANEVYMTSYSPLYSALGSLTLDYVATTPHNYTFEVFRLTGELLHTQGGASSGGSINPTWSFTDSTGSPVNDSGYVFSLTATPQGDAVASIGSKTIRNVISYGEWPRQEYNDSMARMSRDVSALANFAAFLDQDLIGPEDRETYGTIRADFSADPIAIRKTTQTSDLAALTNALGNPLTGAWLWEGHAGELSIIPGKDRHLEVTLTADQIAALLGNDTRLPWKLSYTRRLHYTINTGCGTVNGHLPAATGTPIGVKQEGNPLIKRSAFVGFRNESEPGETKTDWTINIHGYWIDGDDYRFLLKTAVDFANLDYPEVEAWGPQVIGDRFIKYNGEASR